MKTLCALLLCGVSGLALADVHVEAAVDWSKLSYTFIPADVPGHLFAQPFDVSGNGFAEHSSKTEDARSYDARFGMGEQAFSVAVFSGPNRASAAHDGKGFLSASVDTPVYE